MKYTNSQLRTMSYAEWMKAIAKELNDAGFRARGYNSDTHQWQDNYSLYEVGDPQHFFMGGIRDSKALEYLKSIGLVNNGRCPICGNMIEGNPGRFTSGYDSNFHFQICQSCARHGKRTSVNPANNSGCMLALLLFPWYAVKSLFCSITDLF